MALNRRAANRFSANIWPGFVDAMTALLLILMFVLTIFMVVQFAQQETISGQDKELDALTGELLGLSNALGLERTRTAGLEDNVAQLNATLSDAQTQADRQAALIASLNAQSSAQAAQIASLSAQSSTQAAQIAGFEEQVASLMARNTDLDARLSDSQSRVAILTDRAAGLDQEVAEAADREAALQDQNRLLLADKDALERANLKVISEKEALQLALVQARDEIDESTETARLAAAKREALEGLIADLRADVSAKQGSLADALALLVNTQGELAQSRGALEQTQSALEQERAALASAQIKGDGQEEALAKAQADLAAKGLNEEELRARIDSLVNGLSEAEKEKLAEAAAAAALREKLKGAEDELTAMTLSLEAQRKEAENTLTLLAAAKAKLSAADIAAAQNMSEKERQAALLSVARQELAEEKTVSRESARKLALLNQQTVELRKQLDQLQGLLDASNVADSASKVQIESLGANLNTALARVAAEQKKRMALEEAERERLEAETKDLKKFRSEFFGRLRDVLGAKDGIRIVGDRFVFSSEILFAAGSADLGARGKEEIAKVAGIILDVADQIPPEIDWILRVDGHTDKIPLSGFGEYRDNWELSQARALSVVKYLISDLGVPANRLAANGFGEFQPIVDGESPEALAQNRRIELKFTEK